MNWLCDSSYILRELSTTIDKIVLASLLMLVFCSHFSKLRITPSLRNYLWQCAIYQLIKTGLWLEAETCLQEIKPSAKTLHHSRTESSKSAENWAGGLKNPFLQYINVMSHWPDVGRFGLQVAPALVHVIQSVLEEHGFLWAAQSLDHLRFVSIHTLVNVIVCINLSLDVLQTKKELPQVTIKEIKTWNVELKGEKTCFYYKH